jgi:hypothetical protein
VFTDAVRRLIGVTRDDRGVRGLDVTVGTGQVCHLPQHFGTAGRVDTPFLRSGQVTTVTIEGIGSSRNEFYTEAVPARTHVG